MIRVHHLNCVEIQSPGNGRAIGHCKLPQKQYGLKVDKMFNFKSYRYEKEHIYTYADSGDFKRV